MYADEDGDIYQPSMFLVDGRASCISFRRRDDLIIDDDAEFVPHVIF
jgi:glutathionylspermidine synthase